jgi:hypothetical protein
LVVVEPLVQSDGSHASGVAVVTSPPQRLRS